MGVVSIAEWLDAVKHNRGDEVRALLEKGLDVNAVDGTGATMLQHAVRSRSEKVVAVLVENGADVNVAGGDPLLEAAAHHIRGAQIVRLLIEAGADVNARTTAGGYTALIIAAARGYTDSVEILLSAGADVEARGGSGKTAAELAAEGGYVKTQEAIERHIGTSPPATPAPQTPGTADEGIADAARDGETYTDKNAHLMWQVDEDGEERTYGEAVSYCQMLELGGHDDWRLPRKEELQNLARLGFNPLHWLFPSIKKERYWAASSADELHWAENPGQIAYTVDFDPASSNYGSAVTYFRSNQYFVRAVRDLPGHVEGRAGLEDHVLDPHVRTPGPSQPPGEPTAPRLKRGWRSRLRRGRT